MTHNDRYQYGALAVYSLAALGPIAGFIQLKQLYLGGDTSFVVSIVGGTAIGASVALLAWASYRLGWRSGVMEVISVMEEQIDRVESVRDRQEQTGQGVRETTTPDARDGGESGG